MPAEIPAGTYLLRAYTNWMRNAGDEYFYMRSLSIGNSIDTDIQSAITYLPDRNNMQGKIRFYSDNKRSFDKTNIAYSLYSNKQEIGTGILSCNPEGEILIPIKTKKLLPGAYIQINSLLSDYEYEKTFYLPDFSEQFDVSFFPEGGDLLAGVNQTVAFKCQQANGYSKEIKGDIINRQGEVVCTFQSEHDGMGTFSINPSPGEELVARINDSGKTFKLPIAKDYGIVISTIQKKQWPFMHIKNIARIRLVRFALSSCTHQRYPRAPFGTFRAKRPKHNQHERIRRRHFTLAVDK